MVLLVLFFILQTNQITVKKRERRQDKKWEPEKARSTGDVLAKEAELADAVTPSSHARMQFLPSPGG